MRDRSFLPSTPLPSDRQDNEQPAKILVVEDDEVISQTLSRRLASAGYEVMDCLKSGEEALDSASHHPTDLVLMDMGLGGTLDGVATAYELRRRYNIPAIFLTANDDPETLARAKSARPLGYLLKPYVKEDLFRTIELALHSHQIEETLQRREFQFRYFSEATEILLSLDPQTMLQKLAQFMIPHLGDFCFIETISPNTGLMYRLAASHVDPETFHELQANFSNLAAERALDYPAVKAMATGICVFEPSLVPYWDPQDLKDEPYLKAIPALKCTSLLCLPLVADGKPLAALTLGFSSSDRRHTPELLELAQELARRATIALNHSQLHQKSLEQTEQAKWSEALIEKLNHNLEKRVAERTYELRNTATRLETSLKEKDVLLQEVHHRVKNNLQVISSLLRMQLHHISDPATVAALTESQNRIRSMALIHQLLYQSKNLSKINFKVYIETLLLELFRAYNAVAPQFSYVIEADVIDVDLDKAIPCGLIITELVSNALNHGFKGKDNGALTIAFAWRGANRVGLRVEDNGGGFAESLQWKKSSSFGFTIIHSLCKQLGGEGVFSSRLSHGTRFNLEFSLK